MVIGVAALAGARADVVVFASVKRLGRAGEHGIVTEREHEADDDRNRHEARDRSVPVRTAATRRGHDGQDSWCVRVEPEIGLALRRARDLVSNLEEAPLAAEERIREFEAELARRSR